MNDRKNSDYRLLPEVEFNQKIDSLISKLQSKYPVKRDSIKIANQNLQFYSIDNPDYLLDQLIEQDPNSVEVKDERLPYWAELWPSAILMAEYILTNDLIGSNNSVIEIGCGLGLSSIAAAQKTSDITISDYQEDALIFAGLNCLANNQLEPKSLILDWRNPPTNRRYDVILAADVAYEERFFTALENSFRVLLNASGIVLLSEPDRKIAKPFFKSLAESGWLVNKVHENLQSSLYQIQLS